MATPNPPTAGKPWGRRLALLAAQLGLLLGAAELVASVADEGAFPHINVYEADPELGLRLRPGAAQRYKLHGEASDIAINAAGFRGADWGPVDPAREEWLVVGDSQVFGLGVEGDQSISAQLQAALSSARPGLVVHNGGVPTYGPAEYAAVAGRVARERGLQRVIFVINFSNDPFELVRPNRDRHRELDGWAVRVELDPGDGLDFPGRRWLFSRSHLVFHLRRLLRAATPATDGAEGLPSEGTWAEVEALADGARAARAQRHAEAVRLERWRAEALEAAEGDSQRAVAQVEEELTEIGYYHEAWTEQQAAGIIATIQKLSPGDIVQIGSGEEARPVEVTAELLRQGGRLRHRVLAKAAAAVEGQDHYKQQIEEAKALLSGQDARLDALRSQAAAVALVSGSPWRPSLEALRAELVDQGVAVMVVALPLDVQVLPERFAEYGLQEADLSETEVLLQDTVWTARALGLDAVNVLPALRALGPAAYQPGDLHLSPAGYQAVAQAIAAELASPSGAPPRDTGLPQGRSRAPSAAEWAATPESIVRGSSKAGCSTKQAREWLRVSCTPTPGRLPPSGLALVEPAPEAMLMSVPGVISTITMPLFAGRPVAIDLAWGETRERLIGAWLPEGVQLSLEAQPAGALAPPSAPEVAADAALWRCAEASWGPEAAARVSGTARLGCAAWTDCNDLLACASGARTPLPICPEGELNAGAAGHCALPCGPGGACERGSCEPWQGGQVCL